MLFRVRFSDQGMLPYHDPGSAGAAHQVIRSFGVVLESRPLSAQIHLTSELLRTL